LFCTTCCEGGEVEAFAEKINGICGFDDVDRARLLGAKDRSPPESPTTCDAEKNLAVAIELPSALCIRIEAGRPSEFEETELGAAFRRRPAARIIRKVTGRARGPVTW
jgi:hypothetical protein